jgi:signal recognition particle subunit SRP54
MGFGGGGGGKKGKGKKGKKGKGGRGPTPPKIKGGFPGMFPGGMPAGLPGMPAGGGLPDLGGSLNELPPGFDPSKFKFDGDDKKK